MYQPEQIVSLLRQVEVAVANGKVKPTAGSAVAQGGSDLPKCDTT